MTAAHRSRRGGGGAPGAVRSARGAAFAALTAFAADRRVRVDAALDRFGLPARDAALALEIARGVVRRQSLLDHVAAGHCARGLPNDPRLLAALRVGIYQLLFLERVPAHAAVGESVELVGPRERGFVNAVLRRVAAAVESRPADPSRPMQEVALGAQRRVLLAQPLPDPAEDLPGWLAVVSGLPRFLLARWLAQHGESTTRALADAADRRPGLHLRAVAVTRDELAARLIAERVEVEPAVHPRLLRWTGGALPFTSEAFAAGLFVVQDPTAVRAAEAVGAEEGERVLDLCAAPGTKATLLAEAVGARGAVAAFDLDDTRRAKIAENAARLRMPWLRVVTDPGDSAPFDRVLVDAPCSNTGVLARRVEVRHRLEPETIEWMARGQRELLQRALELVRPGGRVVYATCSIEPEECDAVVETVLAAGGAQLVQRELTWPDPPLHDGGYHALLRRDGGDQGAAPAAALRPDGAAC